VGLIGVANGAELDYGAYLIARYFGLRDFAGDRRPGLFHVTNQGAVSWFEFARSVFKAAGADVARVSSISPVC